jgi:serine/threonine protein kinase
MTDLIGRTIEKYRIEGEIGAGGMSRVYRARHIVLEREVALKVMHAQMAADPEFRERFLREAKVIAALRHPNIIDIYDFGEQDGLLYLAMEMLPNGSLHTLQQAYNGQLFPIRLALDLIHQAVDALAYAHTEGFVHRDIKPDNMLLRQMSDSGYHLKLSDFGLAQLNQASARLTVSGTLMGTPAYMSPEQAQGMALDGRTDIYALGVVLYELLVGRLPFISDTPYKLIIDHVSTPPPAPRSARPDLPEAVEAIILRCLAKRPEDRFATAQELAHAIESVLAALPIGAVPEVHLPPHPEYPSQPQDTLPMPDIAHTNSDTMMVRPKAVEAPQTKNLFGGGFVQRARTWLASLGSRFGTHDEPRTALPPFVAPPRSPDTWPTDAPGRTMYQPPRTFIDKPPIEQPIEQTRPVESNERSSVIIRPGVANAPDGRLIEDLILHEDYEQLWRAIAFAQGGRYLLTGYGPFGGTSLVHCAIEKARVELGKSGHDEGALLIFQFQVHDEKQDSFALEARSFRFGRLNGAEQPQQAAPIVQSKNYSLISPLRASFLGKVGQPPSEPERPQTMYNMPRLVADLEGFRVQHKDNHALQQIVQRLIESEALPARIVVIFDRIRYRQTLVALGETALLKNPRVLALVVVRKEDYDRWGRSAGADFDGFKEWYVPCLWHTPLDKVLLDAAPEYIERFETQWMMFCKHLAFVSRGSIGNLVAELRAPRNISHGPGVQFIDLQRVEHREDMRHNAWMQDLLDLNWDGILGTMFVGKNQRELEDRARIGVYHLVDWIANEGRFALNQLLQAAQRLPVTISDKVELIERTTLHVLSALKQNEYLHEEETGRYAVIWSKASTAAPRKVSIKRRRQVAPSEPPPDSPLPNDHTTKDDDEERIHWRELRRTYQRRLHVLELQAAREGSGVDPKVTMEIEHLRDEIQQLDGLLVQSQNELR